MNFKPILIFILLFESILSQNVEIKIENITQKLASKNKLDVNYLNILDSLSKSESVIESYNENELITILDKNNDFKKLVAFYYIVGINEQKSIEILLKNINNPKVITFNMPDFYESTFGDELTRITFHKMKENKSSNYDDFVKFIENLILNDANSNSIFKAGLIKNLEIIEKNHELLRKIAKEKKFPESIIQLAKFKNKNDIEIIINYLMDEKYNVYGIKAVQNFPNNSFLPYLIKIFKKDWKERYFNFPKWRTLYQTLTFYPDSPEIHEAFKKTISTRNKKKRKYLSKYLDIALIKYPNPKFEVYKNSLNYNRNDYLFDLELNAE
ncbi:MULTISPECIES: hypothetical protein [unclassified Flavobacterium]|uniref:hypothetical protein n=1 Tax=unclassified Flavobacterium TaxID=196869 RepID=UPI0012924760|nr:MULTISPECIES: hypothetical protein [unclassified Flavobacterium]MQP52472.1 hypothetical protein [Flavobacterium sp. LMO9]MQP62542.1 hypothetical protein [Flavobacterium sp. LMO6]